MITIKQARWLLRRAVETRGPDFRYAQSANHTCLYVPLLREDNWDLNDDDPRFETGCLVGVALDFAGEVRHRLPENVGENVDKLYAVYGDDMFDFDAAAYFQEAQRVQDAGATWGEALAAAERYFYGSVVEAERYLYGSVVK